MTRVPQHDKYKTASEIQQCVDYLYNELRFHRRQVDKGNELEDIWKEDRENEEKKRDQDEHWTLVYELAEAILEERSNLKRHHDRYMTPTQLRTLEEIRRELS